MSSHDSPPLPDDLRKLFASEKKGGLDVPPSAATVTISMALGPLLAGALAPPTAGDAGAGGAAGDAAHGVRHALLAKAAALFLAGAGLGIGVGVSVPRAPEVRIVERIVERTVEVPVPAAPPASASSSVAAPEGTAPPRSGPIASSASPAASDANLRRERALIERATSAIAHRDGASAMVALDEHRGSFPNGRLTEEREALAVQALVLAKRMPEAQARAARFRKGYPNGLFLPVVEAALRADVPPP